MWGNETSLNVLENNVNDNNDVYVAKVCPQKEGRRKKLKEIFSGNLLGILGCFVSSFSTKSRNLVFNQIMSMEVFVYTDASHIQTLNQNLSII